MSPTPFQNNQTNGFSPSPLKINKDSHHIKKSVPSSSSTSSSSSMNGVAAAANPHQQRHPVIIYTHSPKIIHTHPRDFMALVQKLTGLSRSEDDQASLKAPKSEPGIDNTGEEDHNNHKNPKNIINEDNESASVITDENGSNSMGDGQVNSCFVPPIFDPPNPCFNNIPFFTSNSLDLLCSTQPYYNYSDSMFYMPNMRNSISSSTLEGLKEFPEFQ